MCMCSNSSQTDGTTCVFCYDMVTILHVEYVEYIFFNSFYPYPLKFIPPDAILYLALPKELSQNNQVAYFCPIITTRFHLAAEPIIG